MFRRVSIRLALLGGDMATVLLAMFTASWLRPQLAFGQPLTPSEVGVAWPVYALALVIWGMGFIMTDVYNLQKNLQVVDEIQHVVVAHTVASLSFAGALYFSFRDISRLQIIYFTLICLFMLLTFRLTFRIFLRFIGDKRYGTRRVMIVGAGSAGREIARIVVKNKWTGLSLVGFMDDNSEANTLTYPNFGLLQHTVDVVQEQHINEVIFALPRHAHNKLANLVVALQALKVNVRVVPDFFDLVFLRSVVEDMGGIPLITLREPALDPMQRLIKRSFDIAVSLTGLIVVSPIMAIIAIAIKYDTPGPIIFKQKRVGENGHLFNMYKFRSMVQDAEARQAEVIKETEDGNVIHKSENDPRITKVGYFARRYSLDELPQLFNILQGDMSLVGPRPELPWLVNKYEPWQHKRFEVPQGLTGWWQVNGRSDKLMHMHTEEDLYYIEHYSIWLDIKILWRTIKVVFEKRGAF